MGDAIMKQSRILRRSQTKVEKMLWERLRNRKLNGIKFRRQHPIKFEYERTQRFFIADFYCAEEKLVIELDGMIHEQQKEYDILRDRIMNERDLKILRFKNEQIENDIENVLKK